MKQHFGMLKYLGSDGTSSDEEEDAPGPVRPFVRVPLPWVSQEARAWKIRFDSIFAVENTAVPHNRIDPMPGARPSQRYPVPGLPRNFYDPEWLSSLDTEHMIQLNMKETAYEFAHSTSVEQ
jgi:hypothetical protein